MVSVTRKNRSVSSNEKNSVPAHSSPPNFETLISAIKSQEGLKLSLLRSLYFQLVKLSKGETTSSSKKDDINCTEDGFNRCGFRVKFEDMRDLADLLLKEIESRFNTVFCVLRNFTGNRAQSQGAFPSDGCADSDEFALIFRCSMLLLTLADPIIVLDKIQILLSTIEKIISLATSDGVKNCSISFKKFASHSCSYADAGGATYVSEDFVESFSIFECSYPYRRFLCTALEVFVDELVAHEFLSKYIVCANSASSTSGMFFKGHFIHAKTRSLLETFSAHLILSLSGEDAFMDLLKRLDCRFSKDFRVPELSLTVSISLLLDPIILSAPKMFHVHLMLLTSETIDTSASSGDIRPDLSLMASYLLAFERSIILYTNHLSAFQMDGNPLCFNSLSSNSKLFQSNCQHSFESHVQVVTKAKIDNLAARAESSWNKHLCNMFIRAKSELVAESMAHINENKYIFDGSCRDDILSIISSMVLKASSQDVEDKLIYKEINRDFQDVCLLASILKLMSRSMLEVIFYLRCCAGSNLPKALENASSRNDYQSLVGIIGCFQQSKVHLPNQKLSSDVTSTQPTIHKASEWMLLHFSDLLSLTFASGIGFLVKGCLSTIMSVLNLYLFEEGDIAALKSLFGVGSESLSSYRFREAAVNRRRSKSIASKFQKIQKEFSSSGFLTRCSNRRSEDEIAETSGNASILNSVDRIESTVVGVETKEFCDGKAFLDCIMKEQGSCHAYEYAELADFIQCKQGKNYSKWLKDRQAFRKWRYKNMVVLRWKNKKKFWKSKKQWERYGLLYSKAVAAAAVGWGQSFVN